MKAPLVILLAALLACTPRQEQGHGHDHGHAQEPERPGLSFTHWTEHTELFVELPALVVGLDSAFAAHVTRLADFTALDHGEVSVVLSSSQGEERFSVQKPSVPGIFRPIAKPKHSGPHQLVVLVVTEGFSARHELGAVEVYPNEAAAHKALPEEPEVPGRITFLKEQQWPIRMATVPAAERAMSSSFRTFGTLVPPPEASSTLSAPSAGRVLTAGSFPRVGQRVRTGDVLLVLAPRLEAADQATLDLSTRNAETELAFAEREQARVEAMRTEGVVTERRIAEVGHAVKEARASLEAAQRRTAQFRGAQGAGGSRAAGAIQIRAPFDGVIAELLTQPARFVEAGAPLIRVINTDQLLLEAHVAEEDAHKIASVQGAWAEVEGGRGSLELARDALVGSAPEIDEHSHSIAVYFSVRNTEQRFTSGALADVHLLSGEPQTLLALPEEALIDDNGLWVAFVEVEGEAFERRILEIVVRDRGFVGVRGNLHAGERVATHGAYAVKLAASSGAVPAHGHSH
jgi:cobalt-zinc-cadmium efflux system membrane fusion protein